MRESIEQMVARINASAYVPRGANIMAKPIKLKGGKEFNFKAAQTKQGGGKYPWDEWLNGDLLLLERSETEPDGVDEKGKPKERVKVKKDFDVATEAMLPKIKTAARRRYKVCQVSRLDADGNKLKDGLIIKARDMDQAERQAEDLKRAEEKAAAEEDAAPTSGVPDTSVRNAEGATGAA